MKVVIAEKEEQARRIAESLNCFETTVDGVTIFEGDEYVVIPARGHLFAFWISFPRKLDLSRLPVTKVKVSFSPPEPQKKQEREDSIRRFNVMKHFLEQADEFIVATDWDREGEVIGYNIIRQALGVTDPSDIPRAYFSALTVSEIQEAFSNVQPMNEALLTQGLARNIADTIIGLNLTKALTVKFKSKYPELSQAISIGRVQSPLLSYVCSRSGIQEYSDMIHDDSYRTVEHYLVVDGLMYDIWLNVDGKVDSVVVEDVYEEVREENQAQPLFNTDDVMSYVSELPPSTIMQILESLYLQGYLTYPRTESRYVRDTSFLEAIEHSIRRYIDLPANFSWRNTPVEPIEPAHPDAILLTPEGVEALHTGKIRGRQAYLAKIIENRIVKSFAPPLKKKVTYVTLNVNGEKKTIEWCEYIENLNEAVGYTSYEERPPLEVGKEYKVITIIKERKTKYTHGLFILRNRILSDTEMVKWMAWEGIGTEATRHSFPDLLRVRNYIDGSNLPTMLGEIVAEIIDKIGLTTELTRLMESEIARLRKLDELPEYEQKVVEWTEEFINALEDVELPELKCPEGHEIEFVNRYFDGRRILAMYCKQCNRYFQI